MRTLTPKELMVDFPKLLPGTYKRASKSNARYNCVAFVNGDDRHWWESGCYGGRFYWPPQIKQQDTLEAWIELFIEAGFALTTSQGHERGFEKIAIYVGLKDMLPSHVAKSDGRIWKSKLGKGQDIEHASLEVLEGDQQDEYGIVEAVLKKKITNGKTRKKN